MNRRIRRFLSGLLLALLAFSQASTVLAGCRMDRGAMALAAVQARMPAECPEAAGSADAGMPMPPAGCVAHCTMDLQAFSTSLDAMHAPAAAPILVAYWVAEPAVGRLVPCPAPPPRIPTRILLHSFLI